MTHLFRLGGRGFFVSCRLGPFLGDDKAGLELLACVDRVVEHDGLTRLRVVMSDRHLVGRGGRFSVPEQVRCN